MDATIIPIRPNWWLVPMPRLLVKVSGLAHILAHNPTPEAEREFGKLAFIAEQRAAGGSLGNPIRTK